MSFILRDMTGTGRRFWAITDTWTRDPDEARRFPEKSVADDQAAAIKRRRAIARANPGRLEVVEVTP